MERKKSFLFVNVYIGQKKTCTKCPDAERMKKGVSRFAKAKDENLWNYGMVEILFIRYTRARSNAKGIQDGMCAAVEEIAQDN